MKWLGVIGIIAMLLGAAGCGGGSKGPLGSTSNPLVASYSVQSDRDGTIAVQFGPDTNMRVHDVCDQCFCQDQRVDFGGGNEVGFHLPHARGNDLSGWRPRNGLRPNIHYGLCTVEPNSCHKSDSAGGICSVSGS